MGHHGSEGSGCARAGASARKRGRAGCLEQPKQQGQRQGRCRKGDDNSRDDERLRDRVAAKSRRRAPACDDSEEQEHTAAKEIEGKDLAERLRIGDHAIEAETCSHGGAQPEHGRGAHEPASRSGGPATSRPSVTAIVRVIANSMARIKGLAYASDRRGTHRPARVRRGRRSGRSPDRPTAAAAAIAGSPAARRRVPPS